MSDVDRMMTTVRLSPTLHAAAVAEAARRDMSLNQFMVDAIAHEVSLSPPKAGSGGATYEVTVRFDLPAGDDADDGAYGMVDLITGAANSNGAFAVTTEINRLTAMSPRTRAGS